MSYIRNAIMIYIIPFICISLCEIRHCIYVNSWMQFFFVKTRKIFGAFKTMSYICITYFYTLFSYYYTARFFSYFRAVFFWNNTNNSYICAILFILSNSFMFFRLGFPFYPSGFLLRKSSKNDPYFTDYFLFQQEKYLTKSL